MITDDVEIRTTLQKMYRHFQQLVKLRVERCRNRQKRTLALPTDTAAWGLIGLATISNIIRELDLLGPRQREQMFAAVAKHLLEEMAE
jgi:hypothetical protein